MPRPSRITDADRPADRFADDSEHDTGERAGDDLGGEDVRARRVEQDRWADRAVAVLAGDKQHPGER